MSGSSLLDVQVPSQPGRRSLLIGGLSAVAGLFLSSESVFATEELSSSSNSQKEKKAMPNDLTSIPKTTFHTLDVDGVNVFYREAGPVDAPVMLLLHGFPASSHMYRNLIPRLAGKYRVIAPDLPGFGFTKIPAERNYKYSFATLTNTLNAFVERLGLKRYAMYVFDYGAPVGLRHALVHPEKISALITQNGNAYEEGLGDAWGPFQRYWREPSKANREALRDALTLETTYWAYTHGVPHPEQVAPEAYHLDAALLARPGAAEIQLDLFLDYASNVAIYPKFQEYFRKYKPATLAIWGEHDQLFIPAGAKAYLRDNPNAVVELLDTGHFALETHVDEIASAIERVLGKVVQQKHLEK